MGMTKRDWMIAVTFLAAALMIAVAVFAPYQITPLGTGRYAAKLNRLTGSIALCEVLKDRYVCRSEGALP